MAAVLPHPPLLVPELASGAAAETAAVRAACRAVARRLGDHTTSWVAVGAHPRGRATVAPTARGSFVGFGADVVVDLGAGDGPVDREMALPLLVAGWVRAGSAVRIRGELIAPDASPQECAELGRSLAGEPVGLLVVGDGAATHTEKAPGHLDDRAGPFDAAVAEALRTADRAALAALDPELAAELLAVGRAPWQVLAGATAEGTWTGELLHSSIPFGVAYHVAVWTRQQ